MRKLWRIVSMIALLCLVVGILGVGVGFFTGSSPVIIRNHGSLDEYIQRLTVNWNVLKELAEPYLQMLPF